MPVPDRISAYLFLLLLGICSSATHAQEPSEAADLSACQALLERIDALKNKTESLQQKTRILRALEKEGVMPEAGIRSLFPVPLDDNRRLMLWWQDPLQATGPNRSASTQSDCSEEKLALNDARDELDRARKTWWKSTRHWVERESEQRHLYERLFALQSQLYRHSQEPDLSATRRDWLNNTQTLLAQLLHQSLAGDSDALQASWVSARNWAPPRQEIATEHSVLSAKELQRINQEVAIIATRLRNAQFREIDSGSVLDGLTKDPKSWTRELGVEASMLPLLFVDALTERLTKAYREAKAQKNVGALTSGWVMQILGLATLIAGLLYLGRYLKSQLTRAQQRLFQTLDSARLLKALQGLFWLFKPNINWLTVWLGGQFLQPYLPSTLPLLSALPSLTNTLALYLAARVFREWWGTRIFGRSNQFLTRSQSEGLTRSSQHFALIVTGFYVAYQIIDLAGGGRLHAVLLWTLLITLWVSGVIYCRQHHQAINAFLLSRLPAELKTQATRLLERPAFQLAYPLWVILGQLGDLLLVLHQQLLEFDRYRRLATRILKIRLETTASETDDDESQTQEVTRAYSYWFVERSSAKSGLIRQTELYEAILPPIARWQQRNSPDNTLLISGHQGMGKSTLLNIIEKHWEDTPVYVIHPEEKVCQRQAVESMLAGLPQEEPAVVLLDQVENFFLSEVGHLEGVRALLEHINNPESPFFWVLSVHQPAWRYLSKVFRREYKVLTQYSLPAWNATDVRKLILSRHHQSGFRLTYDELLLAASAMSDSANFRAAESRVFNLLWEQSNGNPEQALRLWLEASQQTQGRVIEIGMPARPPLAPLNELSDDSCFVYGALVRHRRLNIEELVACTNLPTAIVRHALKQGLTQGLLDTDSNQRYQVRAYWYATLLTLLSRKNMLHG